MFKNDKQEADFYKMLTIMLFITFLLGSWRYSVISKENMTLKRIVEVSK